MPNMEKSLLPEIVHRRSGRAFSDTPVSDDDVRLILEAGRLAPSCANTQAWDFVVIRSREVLEQAHEALSRGNAWAKNAPLMIVVATREDGGCGAHGLPYHMMDVGLAVENMLLQAVHVGLMGHPTAGWNEERLKTTLGIPEEYRVVTVVFFGHPADPATLDEETKAKEYAPKSRRDLSEIAHWDRW